MWEELSREKLLQYIMEKLFLLMLITPREYCVVLIIEYLMYFQLIMIIFIHSLNYTY